MGMMPSTKTDYHGGNPEPAERLVQPNPDVLGVPSNLKSRSLPIVTWPNKILEQPSVDVIQFGTQELNQLIFDMAHTMNAKNGVGLAAPQIGVNVNVIVVDRGCGTSSIPRPIVMINPIITVADNRYLTEYQEGCLSVPGYFETRKRPQRILVEYKTPSGITITNEEYQGLLAFIIQHEIDHLRGKTFVDELSSLKKSRILKKIAKTKRG